MTTTKVQITLNLQLRKPLAEIGAANLREYVKDAVLSWSGGYHPDEPLFYAVRKVTTSGVREVKDNE